MALVPLSHEIDGIHHYGIVGGAMASPPSTGGREPAEEEEISSHAGTLDLAAAERSGRRRGGGPLAGRYALAAAAVVAAVVLVATSIALSARSLRKSDEALALAAANAKAIEVVTADVAAAAAAQAGSGAGEAWQPSQQPPTASAAPPRPADPAPSPPIVPPTPPPTAPPSTASPTPHPLNPKWYQTTHADYQYFAALNANSTESNHDWHVSNMLCSRQDQFLCAYDAYCPNGQGSEPYQGGPPKTHNWNSLEATQWAPYLDRNPLSDPSKSHWVQVGVLSSDEGGTDENGFLKCWKYDDWYNGNGVDIRDVWTEEHRMWILCCERANDGGGRT